MNAISRRGFLGSIAAGGAAAMLPRTVLAQAGSTRGLTVHGDQFLLDGKPFQIISGAIHYFRIHPDQWRDRLSRLRALGLNTVETYVAWNFHEGHEFTGWRDLRRFITTAGELGLKVVVRPGPYICAEWDFGGFPARLLADRDLHLRCSDPAYTKEVDAWFGRLLPQLVPLQATRGGPVIAVQVENEYGSFGNDQDHLRHLADLLRGHGIDSLLFCSNGTADYMLRGGTLPGVLSTANFDGDPTGPLADLRRFQPQGPLWCTEYWDGWFDHWGEHHHTTDPANTTAMVDKMLAAGASVNLYMAAGGTNFEWYAGANYDEGHASYQPTVTSYDYDSPVSESGELTAKFTALRSVIGKYAPLPTGPLPVAPQRLSPQSFHTNGSAGLLDSLDRLSRPARRAAPVPMEDLGQSFGLVHYRARVQGPRSTATLRVTGLADRALVFLDGKPVGVLDRNTPKQGVAVTIGGSSAVLDLLVDTGGRVNFGQQLADRKGISGPVMLGGQALYGWEIRPLPLDDLDHLRFSTGAAPTGPAFHRASVRVDSPADGFLALPGWQKGLVWLNGFLLGRYWEVGPQRTLYAPAPLWRKGTNEVLVLELHRPGDHLELRDHPDLG
ncbi:glycoside hydrolase family 35 protein [Kutzneria albida]|uniref:Beta-galactosidase n=1 Tax=Kutzneria albida DSM 43870 TaxID=1449976 RepID=W5WI80_9PSEU|nr:beta-galactosidase family protein [Kutzneria albida]AHI00899.1 hypothetical protein KALB_7541 [Kutzneria albida DSM 43870]